MEKILAFVVNKDKLLLLLGSDKDPQFHESFWYVVTGAVEKEDYDLEDAVRREVWEETGLECLLIKDLDWKFEYESLGKNCIEHAFVVYTDSFVIDYNEESIDYKWCSLDEFVEQIKWYYDKNVLRTKLEPYLNVDEGSFKSSEELIRERKTRIFSGKIITFFFLIATFLAGIFLSIYCTKLYIEEDFRTKDYVVIDASFVSYSPYDNDTYRLTYNYNVDGIDYKITTNGGYGFIPKEGSLRAVKYDSNNPSVSVFAGSNKYLPFLLMGLLFVFGSIVVFLAYLETRNYFKNFNFSIVEIFVGFIFLIGGIALLVIWYLDSNTLGRLLDFYKFWVLLPLFWIIVGINMIFKSVFSNKTEKEIEVKEDEEEDTSI